MEKQIRDRAKRLFSSLKVNVLYVNDKGEFFTRENYATQSSNDRNAVITITSVDVIEEKVTQTTEDVVKAVNMVEKIPAKRTKKR
jgi:hypothetical protein